MIPRDYQEACISSVFSAWEKDNATLAVLPTGMGKTVIFAHVINRAQPKRAMVLAHRRELIFQACDKVRRATGLTCEVEMGDLTASANLWTNAPVVVSSIQTQLSGKGSKRYQRFDPSTFGVLICDEAHHSCAAGWREVIAYYQKNPDLRVLGVTATPDRADRLALGQVFKSNCFNMGIVEGIENGWLVDICQHFVPIKDLDFSEIHTLAGDFNSSELQQEMEKPKIIHGVCQPMLEIIYGMEPRSLNEVPVPEWGKHVAALGRSPRRTILFTAGVKQAEDSAAIFNRAVPGLADWVCGKTPDDKRARLLEGFASGKPAVVVNCAVLTEGYDGPHVEVIGIARPTKSRSLYSQMIGRSTRTIPGLVDGVESAETRRSLIAESAKPRARIVDFVGNSGRHKLVTCLDVLGGKLSPATVSAAHAKALEDGKPKSVLKLLSNQEAEEKRQKAQEREERARAQEDRRKRILARSSFDFHDVDPFNGSKTASNHLGITAKDGRSFSEPQMKLLREAGITPATISYRQGQAIIGKILNKPSHGQIRVLTGAGYQPEELAMSRKEASALIERVKQNGWKRISDPINADQWEEQRYEY